MRKGLLLAALLAPAFLAASARAADPALVAGVEKSLRDDEKAFLAAILTNPAVSAEFDAEAPLALKDPKNLGPFLGVWRAKMEAYAETDSKGPNPDLEGHYANYAQLMTPVQRAYMARRLPTMNEDDRNSLIGYLQSVNDALAKNGTLTWYTKKVVSGIMDHYRQDLTTYIATPLAQTAKRDAAASSTALAAIQKADADARVAAAAPPPPVVKPVEVVAAKPPKPVKAPSEPKAPDLHPTPPVKPIAPVTVTPIPAPPAPAPNGAPLVSNAPAGGALDQARNAAGAGDRAGQVFDGGAGSKDAVGAGVSGAPSGDARPGSTLAPVTPTTTPDGKPNLTATVPSPVPAEANFMDSINKLQTKPAPEPAIKRWAPVAAAAVGGILLGLLGLLLGGPIGAIVGAAVGAGIGAMAGHVLAKHLFQ